MVQYLKPSEPRNPKGMPSGVQTMSELRPQLDDFWNSTESIRIATGEDMPSAVLSSGKLLEGAREHLATVPTGLEGRQPHILRPVGRWTVRNGQMVEFEGMPGPLPEDDRLVVVTTYTSITNTTSVVIDTQVMLFEIVIDS